ncbi:hypothetical protein [Polaribacter porphyrae]|uniref:Uncharacterized protein n=1 Tax=Polaribacter porphyrae TaxID=1137780 RepID=A0A2S7WRL9_9FLAO|nr:hypothetical protein [Polaribacter porphyrae]PQJ80239.1 hypothetical protein BTO18_14100 [Polaribacter porphyrae]
MEITIQELQIIFQKIIEKLEGSENYSIKVKTDIYKLISTDNWDDFNQTNFDTHSLIDDIRELKKLVKDKNRPTTYVDFDRLSSLLREISQIKNPI